MARGCRDTFKLTLTTQRCHMAFHTVNHNSCNQTLSNLHEFSCFETRFPEDRRPHGHQPQASVSLGTGRTLHPCEPPAPNRSILLWWDHG